MLKKNFFGLTILVVLTSILLVGCGQGNSTSSEQETVQLEEMTATFIGLMDRSSFEVTTESGESKTIRFAEKHLDTLNSIMEETITFTYYVDENGQYQLEEIIAVE